MERINEKVVKEAINLLKPCKSDAVFEMSSDYYLNAPPELIFHVTKLVKLFLSHGYVPDTILMCTLIPLVKDNLGDITSSENYRAIAGGCLLLKILDLVMIVLEGDKLNYDVMQFAYQAKSSTTMCSWAVTAVIDHFNRGGATVYSAAMDMSKAFDLVSWQQLFTTLMERKIDGLFLRLMLYIYVNQECNVKWCDKYSDTFSVKNGVRQGAVSSGILFAIYIDELLQLLRDSGLGCHICGVFYGALVFADDIILLSASRSGLQAMVDICQKFAESRNLTFGTNPNPTKSKTKCIAFTKKNLTPDTLKCIQLNGNDLPWVEKIRHLGHTLQKNNSMKLDITEKREAFIGKTNSLLQEFGNVSPKVLIKLLQTFAANLYGSNLWDIFGTDCNRLYTSYNVAIRNIMKVERCTHRYMIEPISNVPHLKTMLSSRFVSFHNSLIHSKKFPIRFLARLFQSDMRTVYGRNLYEVSRSCDVSSSIVSSKIVKSKMCFKIIPVEEEWRIPMGKELLDIRDSADINLPGFNADELDELLKFVCTT